MELDKYDEYVRGYEREVVTVETKIKSTNKGFAMLAKLGWVEGQPLGLSGNGRVDPIPFAVKNDMTGLGKVNQDVRMIETTVSQRRELDSEKQTKETLQQRKAREDTVAKRAAVQSEIELTLRAFYCELCDKQFKNVAQYDEHTNSYAHHHKARFRDMQAAQKISLGTKDEIDKRKEKERKREEKELRKIAKAAGIKMAKPPTSGVNVPSSTPASEPATDPKPSGFKNAAWSSPNTASQSPGPSGLKQSGWNSVGPSNSPGAPAGSPQPPPPPQPTPTFSSSYSGPPPAFRTGGWTSLDTTGTETPAPSQRSSVPIPSTQTADPPSSGWASISQSTSSPSTLPPQPNPTPSVAPLPNTPRDKHSSHKAKVARAEQQESSRSGWQQFRAGGSRRR
ncbi:hypothetical protein NLI96_g9239 [Meripilus lineatus]|uniref:G-patch domain-containing protein n=1 Tax=Meripilus lineatus TaxID=2056292 RepID=A0AAD5V122_9APHY|nr:hypothetical protein NLI96_g9239 [Physisporinus lineatus]